MSLHDSGIQLDEHGLAALARFLLTGEAQWMTPDGKPDTDKMRRLGREFGYPECCIAEFVADAENDRNAGELRGLDPTGRYVPCSACKDRQA